MFTRAIIVAAVVALAAAHDKRYDNEYHHEVEYKENPYDKAYNDAFEHSLLGLNAAKPTRGSPVAALRCRLAPGHVTRVVRLYRNIGRPEDI